MEVLKRLACLEGEVKVLGSRIHGFGTRDWASCPLWTLLGCHAVRDRL